MIFIQMIINNCTFTTEGKNDSESNKNIMKQKNYLIGLNKTVVINTNIVTILHEWKVYLDREKEQRNKLYELESGAFTDVAYQAWKTEEEAKIKLNQLKQMEHNRLNTMISHEGASSIAKYNLYCKRRSNVNQLKSEKNQKLMELMNKKKQQQATINELAKEISTSHRNAKIAKKKVIKEKHKL
ncbi:unnamed protein product, partial [Heterobilharzia americana]